jgi:hypothetical protein
MKAYLIDASIRTVSPVELAEGLPDIRTLIGYDSVDSDESCFLRDQTGKGRFKLDNLAPVADKAVVVGSGNEGATLKDVAMDGKALQQRITWL